MKNYKGLENEEEFTNYLLDESLLEEETEAFHINELHSSLNPKFWPKEYSPLKKVTTIKTKDLQSSDFSPKSA